MDEFYTIKEIQELLKIGKNTAYKLVREPGFPKVRIGCDYRIPKGQFEKWLASRDATRI